MAGQEDGPELCGKDQVGPHQASAATSPTRAGQENHVTMANHAARGRREAVTNAERVEAIELYTAAQAREFNRELKAGAGARAAYQLLRLHLPPLRHDRYLGPELDKTHELVASGAVRGAAEKAIGRRLKP